MRAARARVALAKTGTDTQCIAVDERKRQGGLQFRRGLITRWAKGRLPMVDVCLLSHSHTMSGGCGVEDLAVSPQLKGDNYGKRVRQALGLDEIAQRLYKLCTIVWDNEAGCRKEIWIAVRLPHEIIARDAVRHPELYDRSSVDPDDVNVPSFLQHPITQQFGAANVHPGGYYTDKVKLGQSDSFTRGSIGCTHVRKNLHCGSSRPLNYANVVAMGYARWTASK